MNYFTFAPGRASYAGEVTERSVMMVDVLPSPAWAFPPSTWPRRAPPAGPFSWRRAARAVGPSHLSSVMPAHSASEDARKRAYGAGIHVFCARSEDVDGIGTRACPSPHYYVPQVGYTRLAVTSPAMTPVGGTGKLETRTSAQQKKRAPTWPARRHFGSGELVSRAGSARRAPSSSASGFRR